MQKHAISTKALTRLVSAGRAKKYVEKGTDSVLGDIFMALTGAKKSKAVRKGLKKYRRALDVPDKAVGKQLARIPGLGKLFKTTERIPIREKLLKGKGGVSKIEEVVHIPTAKASAPFRKAQRVAVPVMAYIGVHSLASGDASAKAEHERRRALEEQHRKLREDTMSQVKVSEIRGIMKRAARVMAEQEGEISTLKKQVDFLVDKCAVYMHREEAEKVAALLADRGFFDAEETPYYTEKLSAIPNLKSIAMAAEVLPVPPKTSSLVDPNEDIEKEASHEYDEDPVISYLLGKMC